MTAFAEHSPSSHDGGEIFIRRSSEVLPPLDRPTGFCHLPISSSADPECEHLFCTGRCWRTARCYWDLPTKGTRFLVSSSGSSLCQLLVVDCRDGTSLGSSSTHGQNYALVSFGSGCRHDGKRIGCRIDPSGWSLVCRTGQDMLA